MIVELTSEQRDQLLQLVDTALREIGPEIRHTDSSSFRDDLRTQRGTLRSIHHLLANEVAVLDHQSPPGPTGYVGMT